jgi:tight adherence protein B
MTLSQILLFVSVALCFFFITDAALDFWGGSGGGRVSRRLWNLKTASLSGQEIRKLDVNVSGLFVESYLKKLLMSAESPLGLKGLYFIIAAISILLAAVFYLYVPYVPFVIGLMLAVLSGFGAPILLLKSQTNKRYSSFESQFPDAIELIVRSLRVGQPLNAAILAVASEMPDPIAKEFALAAQEVAYGKTLPGAIEDMLKRIPIQDLRFFVVAIQVQHESGGNLAEVLDGLSKIIRGRSQLMRKVKALTVEGRFSAWFMSLFPILMVIFMSVANPGYYQKVANFPLFPHLAWLTAAMLVLNIVVMRVITKIKV